MTSLIALFIGAFLGSLYSMSCYEEKIQDARKEKSAALESAVTLLKKNKALEKENADYIAEIDLLNRQNTNIRLKYKERWALSQRFGTIRISTH